jgi:hypothetical protein
VYNGMMVMVTSVIWMYNIDIFVSTLLLGSMCLLGTVGLHHLKRQLPAQTVAATFKLT